MQKKINDIYHCSKKTKRCYAMLRYAKRWLAQSDLLESWKFRCRFPCPHVRMTPSHCHFHHYSRNQRDISDVVCPSFAGSPARTSSPATDAPTPGSSRTSASSARRSLPAAITCLNTSKSTAFRGAAGRAALQTDYRGLTTRRSGGLQRREGEGLWQGTAWRCWPTKKKEHPEKGLGKKGACPTYVRPQYCDNLLGGEDDKRKNLTVWEPQRDKTVTWHKRPDGVE